MVSNEPEKLRVMVNANVLFAGSAWPRFPYEVLQSAVTGKCQLVLSDAIIEEARAALMEIAPRAAQRFDHFIASSQYEAIPTPTNEEIAANSQLVRDAKDIHVALAAINTQVDYLPRSGFHRSGRNHC